jgi:hypothetical protein
VVLSPPEAGVGPDIVVGATPGAGVPANDGDATPVGAEPRPLVGDAAAVVGFAGSAVPTIAATAAPTISANGWRSSRAGTCSWDGKGVSPIAGWPGIGVVPCEWARGTACGAPIPVKPRGVRTPTSAIIVTNIRAQTAVTATNRDKWRTTLLPTSGRAWSLYGVDDPRQDDQAVKSNAM